MTINGLLKFLILIELENNNKLSPIYPEVGAMMDFEGATPSQLNEMMHQAAQKVLDEENKTYNKKSKRYR